MSDVSSLDTVSQLSRHETQALEELANRIISRDAQLLRSNSKHLLETGLDLIEAKRVAGHGHFGEWCKTKLGYSKRKAEMQMAAAEMFGCLLKNETVSDLPPVSVAYHLSAPSLDPAIRDRFLPRALKGEKIGPELRRAIRDHRAAAKALEPSSVDPGQGQRGDDGPAACAAVAEQHGQAKPDEGQAAARSAAVTLIVERFGDGLSDLLKLVAEAGPGVILGPEIEGELRARAQVPSGAADRGSPDVARDSDAGEMGEAAAEGCGPKSVEAVVSAVTETTLDEQGVGPDIDQVDTNEALATRAKITYSASKYNLDNLEPVINNSLSINRKPQAEICQPSNRVSSHVKL